MTKSAVPANEADELHILIEDAEDLTPKELAQERKAIMEELKKRSWLTDSPEELAARIPVSVFAMGNVSTGT